MEISRNTQKESGGLKADVDETDKRGPRLRKSKFVVPEKIRKGGDGEDREGVWVRELR